MKPLIHLAIIIPLMAQLSCSHRIGDLTLVSTKNIGQLSQHTDRVEGEDCANYLFAMIPLGNMQANPKTAVDRALEGAKGDMLSDGVLWWSFFFFPYVFMQECYKVEGIVTRAEFVKK